MIIRKIQEKDNLAVKNVVQQSLKSLGWDKPGTAYFDPQLDDLYSYYNQGEDSCYWVVELDGEVVGGVGIAPFADHTQVCELQKLYLLPKAQGMGIANRLMETALAFATQHYKMCYLETLHELMAASKLYEKFDFILLDERLSGSEHSAMDAWYLKDLEEHSTEGFEFL